MRPSSVGLILGACVLAGACATRRDDPRVAPVAVVQASAGEISRPCGGCHEAAEDEWRTSMHHASFTHRDFQRALADDPLPFCVDCHAPRRRDLGAAVVATTASASASASVSAALGVDCVSCHANAAVHEREALAGKATHKTPVTTVACADCHELANPIAATMLQTTESEHQASVFAGVACIDCHMPRRGQDGHRDHEMAVTRNARFLSNALLYSVSSKKKNEVIISLRSNGVGHRFPTGDLFRALLVHCWIEGQGGRILVETVTSLHRDWDAVRRIPGRLPDTANESDTRLGDSPFEIRLPLPNPNPTDQADFAGAMVHVQVDYARGATARGDNFTMFSSLRIADWTTRLP